MRTPYALHFIHEIVLLIHVYLVFECYPSFSLAHHIQVFTRLFHKPMPCQSPKRRKRVKTHVWIQFLTFSPHTAFSLGPFASVLVYIVFTKYCNCDHVMVVGLGFPTTLWSWHIRARAREESLFDERVVCDSSNECPRKGGISPAYVYVSTICKKGVIKHTQSFPRLHHHHLNHPQKSFHPPSHVRQAFSWVFVFWPFELHPSWCSPRELLPSWFS